MTTVAEAGPKLEIRHSVRWQGPHNEAIFCHLADVFVWVCVWVVSRDAGNTTSC